MIDLDKMNLTMIPYQHTLVNQSLEFDKIFNENKVIKRALWLGFGAGIILLTVYKIKNDKENKK